MVRCACTWTPGAGRKEWGTGPGWGAGGKGEAEEGFMEKEMADASLAR